jgi:hypothetical protein
VYLFVVKFHLGGTVINLRYFQKDRIQVNLIFYQSVEVVNGLLY